MVGTAQPRGALIQALIDLGVRHRFEDEDEELVVSATDETRADDAMRRALAEQPQRRRKDFSGTAPGQDWGHEKGWEPPVWPPPPPFAPERTTQGSRPEPVPLPPRRGGATLWLGVLFCVGWVCVRVVPVYHGYTVPQLNDMCRSGLGEVAQIFSTQAAQDCQNVQGGMTVANVAAVAGLVLLLLGVWLRYGSVPRRPG